MKKIVFWGAGKIGQYMLEAWRQLGISPNFFADNQEGLNICQGIKVLSMEEVRALGSVKIVVTCKQYEVVLEQLIENGISKSDIFKGNTLDDMLIFWAFHMKERLQWKGEAEESSNLKEKFSHRVLLDLQSGFVLGGVESWALQMEEVLTAHGAEVKYIVPKGVGKIGKKVGHKLIELDFKAEDSEFDRWKQYVEGIRKNIPCNVVCNFTYITFKAACFAKMFWPDQVNLIAVVHNDEEDYYKWYGMMEEWIDFCMVMSHKIEQELIKRGMDREKFVYLARLIPCEDILAKEYTKDGNPISLGYAGRLVIKQKRLDLLMEAARQLEDKNIDFRLEIAGTGEYEKELKAQVEIFGDKVCLKGYISDEQFADFWKDKDIMVSCSEWEGHSASQQEAMAAGTVPVITDVSGARDDVEDGYNGYVVPVGDIDSLVDRICYLYCHRELLKLMGERSHQRILKKNAEYDEDAMWDRILKKV